MRMYLSFVEITFITFLLIPASITYAAGSAECQFNTQLKELRGIQASTELGEEQKLVAELAIRKQILIDVNDCAIEDVQNTKGTLHSVPLGDDREIQRVHERFMGHLDEAITYYESQKVRLEDIDIEGSKTLAEEIRSWRSFVYLPVTEKISDFIVWRKNRNLIDTAERRLKQFEETSELFSLTNDKKITVLLQRAKANLGYTLASHRRAKRIFVDVNAPDDAPYLIRASLESLADTYENFFALSSAITSAIRSRP